MRALVVWMLVCAAGVLDARALADMTFQAQPQAESRISLGARFWQAAPMGDQSYSGWTLDAPVVQWNLALGERAEGVLGISAYRQLRGGEQDHQGGGDPYFYTKLLLAQGQPQWLPWWQSQLSFIWGVLEPAANRPLGDDRLTFYALMAYGAEYQAWRLDVNYGAAIAESFSTNNQIDIIHVAVQGSWQWRPDRWLGLEYFYAEQVMGHWLDISKGVAGPFSRRQWQAHLRLGQQQQWQLALGSGLQPTSGSLLGSFAYAWAF